MNRGQLEAQVQDYIRAEAIAPPDVQAEVGDREHSLEEARPASTRPSWPGTRRLRRPLRPRRPIMPATWPG